MLNILGQIGQGILVLNAVVLAWLVGRGIGYGGTSIEWCDCEDGCNDCIDIIQEMV